LDGSLDRPPVWQSDRRFDRRSGKQFDRLSPLMLVGLSAPLFDQ